MYLVREVFHAKPGKAKELVKIFKGMAKMMQEHGVGNVKIMTDSVSTYWTVVMEAEVEDLHAYLEAGRNASKEVHQENQHAENMPDYKDLVTGGHREIFKIE